jgi:hypothetical protein
MSYVFWKKKSANSKNNNLQKTNLKLTYHKVLNSTIDELLHLFLWFTRAFLQKASLGLARIQEPSLQEKICC